MYILAIMLERKRILAEKDIQKREDGTKVIVYEHKKTGEVFLIPDPGLQLDQLEHVQIEVVDLLGRHDAAQIPGTETVDPTAPAATSPADGQVVAALPAPDNGIAVVQEPPKAEANAGESPVQAESPAEVEQVVPEEPKIVPEFEKQATPPKATKGRKKTEKTKQVECAKPEPKPAKPAKRVKAVKVAEETAPIETTKPEQAAEKKEEKKPENAPKQKKGVKAIATKDVTTKNKKTTK